MTATATATVLGPYRETAKLYIDLGWPAVLPLPHNRKDPPPKGWTGRGAPYPDLAQVEEWLEDPDSGNIALRLPPDVIAIDVDDYSDKHGADQFALRQAQWGELPPTWISTSWEGTASGIRFYRVPEGLKWSGNVAKDIEVIQAGHRYAVIAPSIHPEGRPYQWIDPCTGHATDDETPAPFEFPPLPDKWVEKLTGGELDDGGAEPRKWDVTGGDTTAPLTGGDPCQPIQKAIAAYPSGKQSQARHDALLAPIFRVVRLSEQGHAGGQYAVDTLRSEFYRDVAGDRAARSYIGEFQRELLGAVRIVLGRPTLAENKRCCGGKPPQLVGLPTWPTSEPEPDAPEPKTDTGLNIPHVFWQAHPKLTRIREYAHMRGVPADPVLYAVLARMSAMLPRECRLETGIGSTSGACLNLFVAAVGPSSAGKSSSAGVAREIHREPERLLGSDADGNPKFLDGVSIGSGEGIAEAFMGTKGVLNGDKRDAKGEPKYKLARTQVTGERVPSRRRRRTTNRDQVAGLGHPRPHIAHSMVWRDARTGQRRSGAQPPRQSRELQPGNAHRIPTGHRAAHTPRSPRRHTATVRLLLGHRPWHSRRPADVRHRRPDRNRRTVPSRPRPHHHGQRAEGRYLAASGAQVQGRNSGARAGRTRLPDPGQTRRPADAPDRRRPHPRHAEGLGASRDPVEHLMQGARPLRQARRDRRCQTRDGAEPQIRQP